MAPDPLRSAVNAATSSAQALQRAAETSQAGWSDDGRRRFDAAHLDEQLRLARQIVRELGEIANALSSIDAQLDRLR